MRVGVIILAAAAVAAATAATLAVTLGGGARGPYRYTWAETNYPNIYLSVVSPVADSQIANLVVGAGLRKAAHAHGPLVCTFQRRISGQVGAEAPLNGTMVRFEVRGDSPLAGDACTSFIAGYDDRKAEQTAINNLRGAVPAIEAYYMTNGTYAGATAAKLRQIYSGLDPSVEVVTAGSGSYCLQSTVGGRTASYRGPRGASATPGPC